MNIYVCPVSGGAFPVQIGLLLELTSNDIKPDLILGSSGGNVAAYIGLAAQWDENKIPNIVGKITSSMFATSWWPSYLSFMPSYLIGYFKGSVYANGSGSDDLFESNFTSETIQAVEMWVGTLNRNTGRGQLFCNRKQEDARIQPLEKDAISHFWNSNCMDLTYVNGDVKLISQITIGSASIPILVPEKTINNQRYVDGGTSFASPLSGLREQILKFEEPIHINYISSFDMQATSPTNTSSIYKIGVATIGELVRSLCVQDRLAALEIIRYHQQRLKLNLNFFSYDVSSPVPPAAAAAAVPAAINSSSSVPIISSASSPIHASSVPVNISSSAIPVHISSSVPIDSSTSILISSSAPSLRENIMDSQRLNTNWRRIDVENSINNADQESTHNSEMVELPDVEIVDILKFTDAVLDQSEINSEPIAEEITLLEIIKQIRAETQCSMLELCPLTNECIDLLNFTSKDIIELAHKSRKNYCIRFWWIGKTSKDDLLKSYKK